MQILDAVPRSYDCPDLSDVSDLKTAERAEQADVQVL